LSDNLTADWTWINDIADRFERAWKDGLQPRIEDYLAEFEEPPRAALLEELLRVEIELRRKSGNTPLADEYAVRFPEFAEVIAAVFRDGESRNLGNGEAPIDGVLAALSSKIGPVPHVLLREADADDDSAVVRPCSPELPASAGRYQLLGQIGEGGMGVVLKGRDPDLGRDLAIKVLREEHRDDADLTRRLIEEAQIGGQLVHPGIVAVHELGRLDDGRPYFTMKLVRGRTLAALLADRQSPADEKPRFLGIFEHVCQTVAYAHARGVIHRDLKPSNIMVGSFGEVQVTDWGLAKVLPSSGDDEVWESAEESAVSAIRTVRSDAEAATSGPGSVMGTPAYMPPEQARGETDGVSERSDVFALGSILCEILTGRPAYTGPSRQAILGKSMRGETADVLERLEGCGADPELVSLARECLEVDPDDRPRDAEEVARRLAAYFAGVQERLRAAERARAAEEARTEEAKATAAAAEGRAQAERRARRMTVGLAASLLIAGALGVAGWTWVERERVARVAARSTQVNAAMREATGHQVRATAAAVGDLVAWTQAEDAAQRARDLLEPGLDPALRTQAESLLADISAEKKEAEAAAAAAEPDRRLRDQLADIRTRWVDSFDAPATEAEYAEVFREAGIDVLKLSPAEAGALIRARRADVALELTAVLDHWTDMRRFTQRDTQGADRLLAVARAADPDPWRDQLRQMFQKPSGKERTAISQRLARSAASQDLPALDYTLLGLGLHHGGDHGGAEAVFRQGLLRHPRDAWLNLQLGDCLSEQGRTDEAIGHYRVVRFFRPEAAHGLAHLLDSRGQSQEALAIFRELVTIRPDVVRHWACYGRLLHDRGDRARAGEVLEKAAELMRAEVKRRPSDDWAHGTLGLVFQAQGKLPEAIAEYREAIRLKPRYAEAHGNLGNALREQKKWDEAIAEYRQAVQLKPSDASLRSNLGHALIDQGKQAEGIAVFQTGLRSKPDDAALYYGLGDAFRRAGKLSEAVYEFKAAIAISPYHAGPHNELGLALRDQGKLNEAVAEFRKAIQLNPSEAPFHSNLGLALVDQGKVAEAIAEYRTAIGIDPSLDAAHANLGLALCTQGKVQEGMSELREALRLNPDEFNAHYNLGLALGLVGRPDDSIAELREAIRLKRDHAEVHNALGSALYRQGNLDEALAEYREAVRLKPGDACARNNLGSALDGQGRLDEAIAQYREAIRIQPNFPLAQKNLADTLRHQGKVDEAMATYRQVIRQFPEYPEVHYSLGLALSDLGKLDEAAAAYREAIRLEPRNSWAHNNLGSVLLNLKKSEEAIATLRKAIQLQPHFPAAYLNLGTALKQQGKLDEAISKYREAIRQLPEYALAHLNLAIALHDQHKLDEAIAEYRKVIWLEPDNPDPHNNIGNALKDQGKLDEAIAEYRKAIRLKPDDAYPHNGLGNTLYDQGKLDEAIAAYREAIRLKPDYAWSHNGLGNALSRQDKLDEAIAEYRQAIRLEPDEPVPHYCLGNALYRQRKLDEAIAEYRKTIRLKPDHVWARSNLGNALHDQKKLDEAVAAFREAIHIKPDLAALHNNLASTLVDQEKLDEAITECKTAIRLDPAYSYPHSNLGNALYDQGKLAEAETEYREAIRLEPDFAMAHNNLAWVLAVRPGRKSGQYDEGLQHVRKAVGLGPKEARFQGTLALVEYRSGHWAESLAASDQALKLRKDGYAWDFFLQAAALWQKSEKDKARTSFDKAVTLTKEKDPKNKELLQFWREAAALLGRPGPEPLAASADKGPH
jgi:serine/threonine-protein kinase